MKLLPSNLIACQNKVHNYLKEWDKLQYPKTNKQKIHNVYDLIKNYQAGNRQENMTHNYDNNKSIQTNPEMTE